MIIHECKTIFVHIPKTGGISLTHAIMSQILNKDTSGEIGHLSDELKYKFDLRGKQKHKQAMFFVPDDISKKLWNEYWKFAIVRNPWDRAVSEFFWRHDRPSRRPSKDFNEFLDYCEYRIKYKDKHDIYWTHAQTQKSYVTNKNGKLILNDIYKFEDMENNIRIISEKMGIPLNMQRHNISKHKPYQEYYNKTTRNKIRRLYKEDIEMFEYEF